jgi:hypothetical protein
MADPVGILGTATGVVSLGLQVYRSISDYLDDLEARDHDLASARAQLQVLRHSIAVIETALPTFGPSLRAVTDPAILAIAACQAELGNLEGTVQELTPGQASSSRVKAHIRTLTYPFNRSSLLKIEDRLQKTNSSFQIALAALDM